MSAYGVAGKENWKQVRKYQRGEGEPKISIDDWLYEREIIAVQREREKANGNGSNEPQTFCQCPETLINGVRMPKANVT